MCSDEYSAVLYNMYENAMFFLFPTPTPHDSNTIAIIMNMEEGHDSKEDASACIDLMKWEVAHTPDIDTFPFEE